MYSAVKLFVYRSYEKKINGDEKPDEECAAVSLDNHDIVAYTTKYNILI